MAIPQEARITLLVHDTRPPFLDGRTVFTKQMEPVSMHPTPPSHASQQYAAVVRSALLPSTRPAPFSAIPQVLPVKDVTSDMAKIARSGSALVREIRQKKDGDKSRERFWELGGTAMGNAIGVKKEERAEDGDDKAALVNAEGEVDYKARAHLSFYPSFTRLLGLSLLGSPLCSSMLHSAI